MTSARAALIREYWSLLEADGVDHLVRRAITAEDHAWLVGKIREQAERTAAAHGARNLMAEYTHGARGQTPSEPRDAYADTAERIETALQALGFDLPGTVYVGEYPHQSFNAQARAMRNGTLLLINTGLHYLIYEVALALSTSAAIVERTDDSRIKVRKPSRAARRHETSATTTLANELAAYILHTDSRRGGKQQVDTTARGFLGYLLARSAATFAVAHEYGHHLAGHLKGRRPADGEWLRKSREQEFEADEIGMLLTLKAHELDPDIASLSFWKQVTVGGAFLFFGLDHLLNRIRAEVDDLPAALIVADHPPSDARAAALRRTLSELEGPGILQLADAYVVTLAGHEDRVLASVPQLLRN
jgi:hypothetical protein